VVTKVKLICQKMTHLHDVNCQFLFVLKH